MTFTYTAPAGGLDNGNINITVPSGWSAPSFTNTSAAGFTSDECGANNDVASGQTIELQGLSMTGGTSCEIIYGNKFEGPGATAPWDRGTVDVHDSGAVLLQRHADDPHRRLADRQRRK